MNITQTFYDNLSTQYDKLFLDWQTTTHEQTAILSKLIADIGFDKRARILDCACGIGTQAIGLAALGYTVTASDISDGELAEANKRAEKNGVNILFKHADFCSLSDVFSEKFDIVIAMDNALPHMLTIEALESAVRSITDQIKAAVSLWPVSVIMTASYLRSHHIPHRISIKRIMDSEFLFKHGFGAETTIS